MTFYMKNYFIKIYFRPLSDKTKRRFAVGDANNEGKATAAFCRFIAPMMIEACTRRLKKFNEW